MANPRNLAKIAPIVSAAAGKLLLTDTATLNGGTANSLVYLNANKEATTVSTFFFDGTRIGINTTTPGSILDVKGVLRLTGSSTGFVGLQAATSGTGVTYTLPASDGLNGQVLQTNGVGSLSWANQTGGGGGGSSGSGTSTSRTAFTATEGQTTFSVEYVVGQVDVYLNGSKLIANNDFTATSGNTVVLAVGATAGSVVEAVVYSSQWITSSTNLYYTGGNIGVGTSSPAALVHAASANTAFAVGTIRIDGADSAGTVNAPVTINAATGGATGNGGSQLYFSTRSDGGSLTERLRIDHRGNAGFGAIANTAWESGAAIQFASETTFGRYGYTRGAYWDGSNYRYMGTQNVAQIQISGGGVLFRQVPGGSVPVADSPLTLATNMILDPLGNLGVGTASPSYKLDVFSSANTGNVVGARFSRTTANVGDQNAIIWQSSSLVSASISDEIRSSTDSALVFKTAGSSVLTERMRIDSSGRLLIGTTAVTASSNEKFEVYDGMTLLDSNNDSVATLYIKNRSTTANTIQAYVYYADPGGNRAGTGVRYTDNTRHEFSAGGTVWYTGSSGFAGERMRITSAGTVLIGSTTPRSTNLLGEGTVQFERTGYSSLQLFSNVASVDGSYIALWKARGGALNSVTSVVAGDIAGGLYYGGYNGTDAQPCAAILSNIDGTPSSTSMPGRLVFQTTAVGSNATQERMRITSAGNVGIGVTDPVQRLEVNGNIRTTTASGGTISVFEADAIRANHGVFGADANGVFLNSTFSTGGSGVLRFLSANAERMRITSGGYLLVGTTSAIDGRVHISADPSNSGAIGTNNNGLVTYYPLLNYQNGILSSYLAQSNTGFGIVSTNEFNINAGSLFTLSTGGGERARITSAGNLLVGRTGNQNNGRIEALGTSQQAFVGQVTDNVNSNFQGFNSGGVATFQVTGHGDMQLRRDDGGPGFVLLNGNMQAGERIGGVTFLSNGVAGQASAIEAYGGTSSVDFTDLRFSTANGGVVGERARITSGGVLLVGTTSAPSIAGVTTDHAFVAGTGNRWVSGFRNTTTGTPWGLAVEYSGAAPNNSASDYLYCYDTALRAAIMSNGGLRNYQSNNVDLSDARTKKDITPAPSYWNKIGALEIVTYKYNDQTHDDVNVGVIAQQVEQVEPVWVDSDGFGETPEDGVPLKTVYTKDITFAAIKALQEAMQRIETLETELAAIKAKLPE